jgi:hypothetical protein
VINGSGSTPACGHQSPGQPSAFRLSGPRKQHGKPAGTREVFQAAKSTDTK